MIRRGARWLCLALVLLGLVFRVAAEPAEIIIAAQDLYYSGRTSEAENMLKLQASEMPLYWQTRRAHLEGLIAARRGDNEVAEELFNRMRRMAEEIAVADPAVGLALQSEARSRLMLIRGIAYAIRNAPRTERLARASLEVDPTNTFALLVLAQGKINAPRLFGGDVDFGIEKLSEVSTNRDIEKAVLFRCLYGLSQAWQRKKDLSRAKQFVDAALDLYPENPNALKLRIGILAGSK